MEDRPSKRKKLDEATPDEINDAEAVEAFPKVRDSVRLASYVTGFAGLSEKYRAIAEQHHEAWVSQKMRLPCVSPKIKFERRHNGFPIYGHYLGIFHRGFCIVCHGVAYWYYMGNHPDRGNIPMPSRAFDPNLKHDDR